MSMSYPCPSLLHETVKQCELLPNSSMNIVISIGRQIYNTNDAVL